MSRILILLAATWLAIGASFADPVISGTAQVTDGDTLSIGPVIIRLHGIDAPEAGQQCRRANGKSWQCGAAATNRLAELVEGHRVDCLAIERDAYRRIIGRCTANGIDVNETLVSEGLAWAFTRYSDDFASHEASAQLTGVGIWDGEAQPAWEYRAARWERAADASPRPGCPIKGNINRAGEKIYHTPWSPWYDRTSIDESKGQRWFCDEEEAQAAGWRAARWN